MVLADIPFMATPTSGANWGSQTSKTDAFGRYPWTMGYGGGVGAPVNLGRAPVGGTPNPYANPVRLPLPNASGIIQIPRSTQQGNAVNQAWTTRTGNQNQQNQSLTDFAKSYLATKPEAQAFNAEETAAIGKYYGSGPGSVTGDLSAIEARRGNAITQAAQSAIRQAARSNSMRRMSSGNNSANDRAYSQQVGNIAAQTAADRATNDAANYRWVAGQRTGLTGARQKLLNDMMMRDLQPMDLRNRYERDDLSTLGTLAGLENSNTIYDDTALRRQQLLNSLA